MSIVDVCYVLRDKPYLWHLREELLRIRFRKYFLVRAPSASFEEQSVDEGTI